MNLSDCLTFDIETMGLDATKCRPTVACTYDGETTTVYHLLKPADGCACPPALQRHTPDSQLCTHCTKWHAANAAALFAALDSSPHLCGYNCIRFDIPFLQQRYALDSARVGRWVAKCVDLFFFVCHVLDVYCKLQRLLEMNGMQSKSASGQSAIAMAECGQWDRLASYCSDDVRLTHHLTAADSIRVPALRNTASMCVRWTAEHSGGSRCGQWWSVHPDPDPFGHGAGAATTKRRSCLAAGGRSSKASRPGCVQSLFGDDPDDGAD